jgi:hypothetical protein
MTYYEVLGISSKASANDVTLAYRRKASQVYLHGQKSPQALRRFVVIRRAFDVLSSPYQRTSYDEQLAACPVHTDVIDELHLAGQGPSELYYNLLEHALISYKLSFREFSTVPLRMRIEKICGEIVVRLLLAAIGAGATFAAVIYLHSGFSELWEPSAQEIDAIALQLSMTVPWVALLFIFAKELRLVWARSRR